MKIRKLGKNGPEVSAIGLGCMGMSEFYGPTDDRESTRVLEMAVERGCNFFDTADVYGLGHNEELLGNVLRQYPRENYFLATKCGLIRDKNDLTKRGVDNSPEFVKARCDDSLRRLGLGFIDLYYIHRIADHGANIEETMGAMAELLQLGKIRYVGLSEASAEVIRRANAALLKFTGNKHQLTAVQTEYSLMTRGPEVDGVLAACRDLGIGLVAYGVLGRKLLTNTVAGGDDFTSDDFRRTLPRFQGDNLHKNQGIVEKIAVIAKKKNCLPSQLCLAWVLAKWEHVIPIPGTKRTKYLENNLAAVDIELTPQDLASIDRISPFGAFTGLRYTEKSMQLYGFKSEEELLS